jgi:hypothetical protein
MAQASPTFSYFLSRKKVGKESPHFLERKWAKNFPELCSCVQRNSYRKSQSTVVGAGAAGYCERVEICGLAAGRTITRHHLKAVPPRVKVMLFYLI